MTRQKTDMLPRTLVADALGVMQDTLPPGDLPMDRFAQRFLMFLRDTEDDEDFARHPEVWTATLASTLAHSHPQMALDGIAALLAKAETADEISLIGAGPMTELFLAHGPDLLTDIEDRAIAAPRFAMALGALYPDGAGSPLFWARLRGMERPIDETADLPGPEGLID